MSGSIFSVEVQPRLPARIARLNELANDLYYSWDRNVRRLFSQLDPATWISCNKSPKLFLRRVSQSVLDQAAQDPIFLADYGGMLSIYDTYLQERPLLAMSRRLDAGDDLVAYFSLEFGLHQSVPIYAGGLGILAGDYCKAMSNLWMPFVGIGLLYREGYFTQRILCSGEQQEDYPHVDPGDLPIRLSTDAQGDPLSVSIELGRRSVRLQIWEAKVGHISLYLLDSDLEANAAEDRAITYKLYGGGAEERIRQELVLGIGGTRALQVLGLQPTVWHINEGHAGFMIVERCRALTLEGWELDAALTLVASNTVFTTHTPVPAGHDIFHRDLLFAYFGDYLDAARIDRNRFLQLGYTPANPHAFNMTALSLHGSSFHNGVSRIHGRVASKMEAHIWPQVPPEDNPITYVTNGIDAETFLGQAWGALFDMYTGRGWRSKLIDADFWRELVFNIPDHAYRSVREIQKAELLNDARARALVQFRRNGANRSQLRQLTRLLDAKHLDTLVIGFARRFATYKRATLLFRDLEHLARLLNDERRPVLLLFAGKAHPNDQPGKQLIREIMDISLRPEFLGKVLLLEDYNLSLARKLYSGVDVWLNVPEYPKEACGTSGMKAAINGAINLSVLDGWWAEAYNGDNGWAIEPSGEQQPEVRDGKESLELLDLLEQEVIPLFFQDGKQRWTAKSKASMLTILPRFNSIRMAQDYLQQLYLPARDQGARLHRAEGAGARELASWMRKLHAAWPRVRIRQVGSPVKSISTGDPLPIEIAASLGGLEAEDVRIECLLGSTDTLGQFQPRRTLTLTLGGQNEQQEHLFRIDLNALPDLTLSGLEQFKIRIYPQHPLLAHRFATGCMLWL